MDALTPGRRRATVVRRGLLVIAAVVAAIAALEGVVRLSASASGLPQTPFEFRRSRPAPYREAGYFSEQFLDESFRQPGSWRYPEGTRLIVPGDFSGRYFNVAGGVRVTTDVPPRFSHTVHIFGGSTVYNSEVPDGDTIASCLQRLINAGRPGAYRVVNYGATSVSAIQQLERLHTVPLAPGDLVVFYDGVNDVLQALYYASPAETMLERNRRQVNEMGPARRLTFTLYRAGAARSSLLRTLDPSHYVMPAHLREPAAAARLSAALVQRYLETLTSARSYAHRSGASFRHFLQPHLFAATTLTPYEAGLVGNRYLVQPGIKEALQAGYAALRAALAGRDDLRSTDVSEVLVARTGGSEYFLDAMHVNHTANARIAAALFSALAADLGAPAESRRF